MKKLLTAAVTIALIFLAALPTYAAYFTFDPKEEEKTAPQDYYDNFAAALPDDLRDSLGEIFTHTDTASAPDPWTSVAEYALDAISESLTPAFARLAVLTGVIIIAAVWRTMSDTITEGERSKAFSYLVRITLALTVLKTQTDVLASLTTFSNRLCTTAAGFIPAMSAVYLASGNVTTSLLTQSGLAMLITLAENIFAFLILPAIKATFALSSVACVTGQTVPSSIAAFIRNTAAFVCTAAMTVFSFIFSLRLKVGEAADTAAMKTVQFAVGNFIPIVGGAVSESVGHVGAFMSFIKATCGSAAVAVILILVLPTLVGLALNRAVLFIAKHTCAALSLPDEEKLLSELGSGATLALAYAVSVTVMFVICMSLFVKSATAA